MPARLSSEGPLLDYKLPGYRYYPTELLPHGIRDWSRVLLLQACERLRIPADRWPRFSEPLQLPAADYHHHYNMPPFSPPGFDELRDSSSEWLERAVEKFREHCAVYLGRAIRRIESDVKRGILMKIPQTREKPSALALRYEWAAKRYCFNEPYKDLATPEHNPEQIRKAVNKILTECQVPNRK